MCIAAAIAVSFAAAFTNSFANNTVSVASNPFAAFTIKIYVAIIAASAVALAPAG